MKTGNKYILENVILTASENPDRDSKIVTDYFPLRINPTQINGDVDLRFSEEENEVSYIYQVSLTAYDISDVNKSERLAMDNRGNLVAARNPIKPLFAVKDDGFYVTEKVLERDNNYFQSNRKGNLTIGYDLRDFYNDINGTPKITIDEGGGGVGDPPPKGPGDPELKNSVSSRLTGNYVTINTKPYDNEAQSMGHIYARIKPTLPVLVDFTNYITKTNNHWFVSELSWERYYKIDQFAFYRYRKLPVISEISLNNAVDNELNNVTAILSDANLAHELSPNHHIDLTFSTQGISQRDNVHLVLKVVGYYEEANFVGDIDLSQRGFSFDQNYPNPFNPMTTFSFSLPVAAPVSLTMYNVLGQRVINLADKTPPAGRHEIVWDGRDSDNKEIASGIYFAKLKAADFTATRKLIMVK